MELNGVELDPHLAGRIERWIGEIRAMYAAIVDGVDDRVVNEVCDNCGSPLVVVRSRAGRFCTSECAEAFELS